MKALLILDSKHGNAKVMVRLRDGESQKRVVSLLGRNRAREAFEVLKREAQVSCFLPRGAKLPVVPDLTLVEDLIGD